ncbi:hypothetical protein R6Q57_004520 [Mikania cordata]
MDIDLLWSFGGWLLILFPETINYCMAKLRFSSQISHFSNPRSSSSLFFIAILILLILITELQISSPITVASLPTEPISSNSHHESSKSTTTFSSHDETSRSTTATTTTTTTNFRPKRTHDHQSHPKSTRSFEAGAHEVPSGPNPISN